MSEPKSFAGELATLVNQASWGTPKIDILKALDDQRVNVLRWIEAERDKVDKYLAARGV